MPAHIEFGLGFVRFALEVAVIAFSDSGVDGDGDGERIFLQYAGNCFFRAIHRGAESGVEFNMGQFIAQYKRDKLTRFGKVGVYVAAHKTSFVERRFAVANNVKHKNS